MKRILPVAQLGCVGGVFEHSAPPPQARYLNDGYATLYLGEDGVVVTKQTQAAQPQEEGYWRGDDVPALLRSSSTSAIRRHTSTNPDRLSACPRFQADARDIELRPGDSAFIQKNRDHHSNLYGDYVDSSGNVVVRNVGVMEDPKPPGTYFRGAPMPYFMRIYSGVGMHAGYLPGVPDSHGCIRMPLRMAQTLLRERTVRNPGHRHR